MARAVFGMEHNLYTGGKLFMNEKPGIKQYQEGHKEYDKWLANGDIACLKKAADFYRQASELGYEKACGTMLEIYNFDEFPISDEEYFNELSHFAHNKENPYAMIKICSIVIFPDTVRHIGTANTLKEAITLQQAIEIMNLGVAIAERISVPKYGKNNFDLLGMEYNNVAMAYFGYAKIYCSAVNDKKLHLQSAVRCIKQAIAWVQSMDPKALPRNPTDDLNGRLKVFNAELNSL